MKEESERKRLAFNIGKTKCIRMSKNTPRNDLCGKQAVEQVESFNYLGSMMTENVKCEAEIKTRIGIAKNCIWHHEEISNKQQALSKNKEKLRKNVSGQHCYMVLKVELCERQR